MQKMSPVASKLSEIWQFLYIEVTWNLNFTKFLDLEISVNFRDRNPYPLRGRVNQVLIFEPKMFIDFLNMVPKTQPEILVKYGQ